MHQPPLETLVPKAQAGFGGQDSDVESEGLCPPPPAAGYTWARMADLAGRDLLGSFPGRASHDVRPSHVNLVSVYYK